MPTPATHTQPRNRGPLKVYHRFNTTPAYDMVAIVIEDLNLLLPFFREIEEGEIDPLEACLLWDSSKPWKLTEGDIVVEEGEYGDVGAYLLTPSKQWEPLDMRLLSCLGIERSLDQTLN